MTAGKELSIKEREALLDKEIAERQKLKEAYRLVREDLERQGSNGANAAPADDDGIDFFSVLPDEEPRATYGPPTEKEYGENTKLVRRAISKMTDDYTIRDIHSYLRTHGHDLGINPIATVLNRLKNNGEIKVRVPGAGRRPTLFKR
jgi:hypothetical protein